jgi:hypothetical protein
MSPQGEYMSGSKTEVAAFRRDVCFTPIFAPNGTASSDRWHKSGRLYAAGPVSARFGRLTCGCALECDVGFRATHGRAVAHVRGSYGAMNRHRIASSITLVGGGEQWVAMVKLSVKAGQKANSKLACATNFPVDANETRVSVKADALPKRKTSALT